jgi:hypothetical protein
MTKNPNQRKDTEANSLQAQRSSTLRQTIQHTKILDTYEYITSIQINTEREKERERERE